MAVIWTMRIIFGLGMALAIVLGLYGLNQKYGEFSKKKDINLKKYLFASGAVFIFSLIGFCIWNAAVYIPATSTGVVENTTSGSFSNIGPGIHVWPLQPKLIPFTSRVTEYSLKRQRIEIGTVQDDEKDDVAVGIASGSGSPGNPVVYIQARGWATPDPQTVLTLHKLYGPDYLDAWVERNWVTAVKTVQGQHPYDYLIKSRQSFADEVEETLQSQLVDGDQTLVDVSQLAITQFDFDNTINAQLDETAKKQFEQQRAQADVEIARQQQEKAKVEAQTRLQVAQTDAQTKVAAARAEAEAVRLVNDAIASQGDKYLFLKWIEKWNGDVPKVQTGDGGGTFFQLPLNLE